MKVDRKTLREFCKALGNEVLFEPYEDAFRKVLDDTHKFMTSNFPDVRYVVECGEQNNPLQVQRDGECIFDLYVKDETNWFLITTKVSNNGVIPKEIEGTINSRV